MHNKKTVLAWPLALCLTAPVRIYAHHSFAEYDQSHPIELNGKLTEVRWENPHVHFTLQTTDQSGHPNTWDMESNS